MSAATIKRPLKALLPAVQVRMQSICEVELIKVRVSSICTDDARRLATALMPQAHWLGDGNPASGLHTLEYRHMAPDLQADAAQQRRDAEHAELDIEMERRRKRVEEWRAKKEAEQQAANAAAGIKREVRNKLGRQTFEMRTAPV